MVRKTPGDSSREGPEYVPEGSKDYRWFEMGIFTRWDYPDQCRILCVDIPPDLHSGLKETLPKHSALDFKDPFIMQRYLIDRLIAFYDLSVWRLRDSVREIEKVI